MLKMTYFLSNHHNEDSSTSMDSPEVSGCCDWLIIEDLRSLNEDINKKSGVIQNGKSVLL